MFLLQFDVYHNVNNAEINNDINEKLAKTKHW